MEYGAGIRQEISSPWGANVGSDSDSGEWQMMAAETIAGINKILWRYNPTRQLHVWLLDSSWGPTRALTSEAKASGMPFHQWLLDLRLVA